MRFTTPLLAAALLLAASCNDSTTTTETTATDSASLSSSTSASSSIKLADVPPSPDFAEAKLHLAGMTASPAGADSVKIAFKFHVDKYELMAQTSSEAGALCNNSDKGQHIHFILDNKPYVALYEPKHETTVQKNSEHHLLCFLSRSYHESVKGLEAAVMVHFKVDGEGKIERLETPEAPMLFYSRPKGDYLGKDTANVLLDFYPVNAKIGLDYKVKADIRNENTGATASFTFDTWKPAFLQGLGTGKTTVVLTLIDKDGKPLTGEHTSITRTINLAAAEPM